MAKKIRNPIEVKLVLTDGQVEVSAHYGLGCTDCGQGTRKGMSVSLNANTVKDVFDEIEPQMLANEPGATLEDGINGIPEPE